MLPLCHRGPALIREVMGVMEMYKQSRTRKVGHVSREHDCLGEIIMTLTTWYSLTVEKVEKVEVMILGEMCCGV